MAPGAWPAVVGPRFSLLVCGLALLAGCLDDDVGDGPVKAPGPEEHQLTRNGTIDHALVARLIGEPVVMDHNHSDPYEHMGSHNIGLVGWSTLGEELGQNGFANFVLRDEGDRTYAYVAIDGDNEGGFNIADITDPGNVTVLGQYRASGSGFQEVRVTADGRYAIQNVQDTPTPPPTGPGSCSVCIHVVNIEDPASPQLEFVLPIEILGTHNFDIVQDETGEYVFYVGQPLDNSPPGNRVGIARFVETPAGMTLVNVGTFAHPAIADDGRSYPHDVLVQMHPNGQRIAYVSHWDGGLATFDASNLPAVVPLGVNDEQEPSGALAIHWVMQEPTARHDGRTIVWSAPEIGSLDDGTGVIRAYDGSDPAALRQIATWQLPGDLAIEGRYILSPHTAIPDMERGLLAVAHYHAGIWILDISVPEDPKALGYYFPVGDPAAPHDGPIWWKKPNFSPDGFLPNVYMARWHDGLLWVTERGTGLYALEYTGPVPGPLACPPGQPGLAPCVVDA